MLGSWEPLKAAFSLKNQAFILNIKFHTEFFVKFEYVFEFTIQSIKYDICGKFKLSDLGKKFSMKFDIEKLTYYYYYYFFEKKLPL